MTKYEVIIYWSEEDEAFVAEVPELPGCAAHGPTQGRALSNAQDAIRLWIDTA
jgi:predicted RNase H-like HicB family nuclease